MNPNFFWMGGMWIFPLIFIVIGIFFFGWFFRGRGGCCGWFNGDRRDNFENKETPMDILNKRYAKGEISKEEYEKIKKDILS